MAAPMLKSLGVLCPRCLLVNRVLQRGYGVPIMNKKLKKKRDIDPHYFSKKDWNLEHGLPKTGYEYGPLTEVPDWSYADGRPAPPASKAILRQKENRQLAVRAMRLISEMQFAKERHQKAQEDEAQRRQAIMDNKLKAKS